MFYYERDGEAKKVVGVLTDWDLAEEQEDDGTQVKESEMTRYAGRESENALNPGDSTNAHSANTQGQEANVTSPDDEGTRNRQKAKYRTGTGPFMACDLLETGPTPTHLYRHDLESFFWVLAWFCAIFNPVEHTVGVVPAWHQNNLVSVGQAKRQFLKELYVFNAVFKKTHADYRGFVERGLKRMWRLFDRAVRLAEVDRTLTNKYFDALSEPADRRDEMFIEETLMDLKDTRTRLRDLITYDTIMSFFNNGLH